MSVEEPVAPWFYRKRFSVIGMIYAFAFLAGHEIAGLIGVPPLPAFLTSGRPVAFGVLAVALALGGYALRVWASSYLAAAIVWTQDVQIGELRVSGPYRWTRNPLYLGNVLQAIGVGMLGPWPVTALATAGMLLFSTMLIAVEERALAGERGDAYARYRAQVPRFFPLPWKHAAAGTQRGSLRDGLRSEMMTAAFAAVVMVVVVVFLVR